MTAATTAPTAPATDPVRILAPFAVTTELVEVEADPVADPLDLMVWVAMTELLPPVDPVGVDTARVVPDPEAVDGLGPVPWLTLEPPAPPRPPPPWVGERPPPEETRTLVDAALATEEAPLSVDEVTEEPEPPPTTVELAELDGEDVADAEDVEDGAVLELEETSLQDRS